MTGNRTEVRRTGVFARVAGGGLLLFGVVCLAATFAGYMASFRYLEMLADYRPYLLCACLGALVGGVAAYHFGVRGRWMIAAVAIAAVGTIVNALEVLPWVLASKPVRQSEQGVAGRPLKAVAFNVEGANTNFMATRAFIERESPDLVMLCEATARWSEELTVLKQGWKYHFRAESMDIELYSRHPIVRTQLFAYGPNRGFVAAQIQVDQSEFTVVATHTYPRHWYGDEGYRHRTQAIQDGLGRKVSMLQQPVVVLGDLNASSWSPAYKAMMRTSGLRDARWGNGLAPSHHGHGPVSRWLWRPIDHCLYSPEVSLDSFKVGPDLGSDHLPIVVTFRIPPGAIPGSGIPAK